MSRECVVGPKSASENNLRIVRAAVTLQSVANALLDGERLRCRVRKLVDAVDENDNVARFYV